MRPSTGLPAGPSGLLKVSNQFQEFLYGKNDKTSSATVVAAVAKAKAAKAIKIQVLSSTDQSPIAGATVVAFTDFANKAGAQGVTDANGQVSLALGTAKKIERLYIYAEGMGPESRSEW